MNSSRLFISLSIFITCIFLLYNQASLFNYSCLRRYGCDLYNIYYVTLTGFVLLFLFTLLFSQLMNKEKLVVIMNGYGRYLFIFVFVMFATLGVVSVNEGFEGYLNDNILWQNIMSYYVLILILSSLFISGLLCFIKDKFFGNIVKGDYVILSTLILLLFTFVPTIVYFFSGSKLFLRLI